MNRVQRKLLHISWVLWYYILYMIICISVWYKYKRFWALADTCLPSFFLSLVDALFHLGNLGITSLWGKNIAFRLKISPHGSFVKLYIQYRLLHVSLRLISSRIVLILCFSVALHLFSHSQISNGEHPHLSDLSCLWYLIIDESVRMIRKGCFP